MQYDDFLEQVARRTGLNRAHGGKAIVAVLETLSERIGSKEASDLAAELPRQLQAVVAEAPEEPAQFPADDFVRKVAAREWVPSREARVHAKVVEGNRERIQVFEGVVIRVRQGGPASNFTVRRIASHGVGVERTFLRYSPRIDKVEITRRGKVRRANLYYLRGLTGKAARIKERGRPGR